MPGKPQKCTHEDCTRRPVARRLCRAHYQQAWKSGKIGQHAKLPPREQKHDHACPPSHTHANATTCYIQHQCRCEPCCRHNRERETHRKKQIAYGRYDSGLVAADPVRDHVMRLSEYGIGYKRVAELAGVHTTIVRTLIWGREDPARKGEMQKRMKRENAERILSVQPSIKNLGARQSVPARSTHRRIQALVARGWSISKVARELGWSGENFHSMMQREKVGAATHRAVAELYERLWDVEPPRETHRDKIAYSRALNFAAKRRWLPPLAWDDIDLDEEPPAPDLECGVDEMAVELAISGDHVRLTPDERREAVRRLHASRWSDKRIAETIHCADRTVLRIREELGLKAFDQSELRNRGAAA